MHNFQNEIENTQFIKTHASKLGFSFCGIAKAEELTEDAKRLETWLSANKHGKMSYMENHFDLRIDPRKLVPGAKSIVTLLINYFPEAKQNSDAPKISKYAYGHDYHFIIKDKLSKLLLLIENQIGKIEGRGFVDSAPILERTWANKSGAGWIGKNGNLINKGLGSFYFIATLVIDLPLIYDSPFVKNYCGTCKLCIEACPTGAIEQNKIINGSKCISYFTIELKDAIIPSEMKDKFEDWVFGCDICQDICPWNRFSQPTKDTSFTPLPEILNLSTNEWLSLTEDKFKRIFKNSPLSRTKYKGIQRNLKFVKLN